jgi:tripartite-type tricarboxylate transporter receptor subunit TctC
MASLAIVQPQWRADRIKLIALNNKTRTSLVPGIPTALEEGYPSLVFEGLHGLIGLKTMSKELKERIAADFKEAAADGSIASRLAATGSVINVGGPDEFSAAIEEQRAAIAATVKAINFKPKN